MYEYLDRSNYQRNVIGNYVNKATLGTRISECKWIESENDECKKWVR